MISKLKFVSLSHRLISTSFERVIFLTIVLISVCFFPSATTWADEPAASAKPSSFRSLLEKNQRNAIKEVAEYIAAHPDAEDLEQAAGWMFETASQNGLESDVVEIAEKFLRRPDLEPAVRSQAEQALCLGLARAGKRGEAFAVYESYLRGARFQSPFRSLDLASTFSGAARLEGDLNGSREIFERLAATYPLNAQIADIVEGRLSRQELIGQAAPSLGINDLEGKRVEIADYANKVLLIDFWGTNCAPCIAEFPNMKQIYKEYHDQGFEILGVSFDDGPATVDAYRTKGRLPWRMSMNSSPEGAVSTRYRVRTIPALFLVDRTGKIAQVDLRGPDLRTAVTRLLK